MLSPKKNMIKVPTILNIFIHSYYNKFCIKILHIWYCVTCVFKQYCTLFLFPIQASANVHAFVS